MALKGRQSLVLVDFLLGCAIRVYAITACLITTSPAYPTFTIKSEVSLVSSSIGSLDARGQVCG